MRGKHKNRMPPPTSPGEIILGEWLEPQSMKQTALAEKMGVDVQVVNSIVRGRRAVTAHTALRLADALGTTPEFWMNAQAACDLWAERQKMGK